MRAATSSRPASADADQATAAAQAAFENEGERFDVRPRTFADRPLSEMNRELDEAETAFADDRRYAGIAIHDYQAFRRVAR